MTTCLSDAIRYRYEQLVVQEFFAVNEQIVSFTRKLNVKMYIKDMPTPYGIEIYALCCKSGLLYDFILYQG